MQLALEVAWCTCAGDYRMNLYSYLSQEFLKLYEYVKDFFTITIIIIIILVKENHCRVDKPLDYYYYYYTFLFVRCHLLSSIVYIIFFLFQTA
jgi:hypothetical protein